MEFLEKIYDFGKVFWQNLSLLSEKWIYKFNIESGQNLRNFIFVNYLIK